jgi:hypothetical protein
LVLRGWKNRRTNGRGVAEDLAERIIPAAGESRPAPRERQAVRGLWRWRQQVSACENTSGLELELPFRALATPSVHAVSCRWLETDAESPGQNIAM